MEIGKSHGYAVFCKSRQKTAWDMNCFHITVSLHLFRDDYKDYNSHAHYDL